MILVPIFLISFYPHIN